MSIKDINDDGQLKMDWKERSLLSINFDFLWRCILFSVDQVFTYNDKIIHNRIREIENLFYEKHLRITKEMEDKDKQFKKLEKDYKTQIDDLLRKVQNAQKEKVRVDKIAQERYFELQTIRNDMDIVALKTYTRDLEANMLQALKEKKPQMEACQKLINVMRKMIPTKEKGVAKVFKFRLRRRKRKGENAEDEENEEITGSQKDVIIMGKKKKKDDGPTAVDELMEYLYDNYTELFDIAGEEKERAMLDKEQVLKILDDIPDELLEKCLVPPKKPSAEIEIQTMMTMAPGDLSKNDIVNAFNSAYAEKDGKVKPKGPKNLLLKSIGRFLINSKKERIQPMGEANAFKMVQGLLEDKLQQDMECEKNAKEFKHLPNYVLDQLSMKFGLKTIAIKNLISLKEGLATVTKTYKKENTTKVPYSQMLTSIMGLDSNTELTYDQDQVTLIIKARPMWHEAQEQFKKNIQVKRNANLNDFSLSDLQTGGTCSAIEVIDVFTSW